MTDIAEFLTARLDEDEQIARAAAQARDADGARWQYRSDLEPPTIEYVDLAARTDVAQSMGNWPEEVAEHIARHDPARVLAEVAAKRAILVEHQPQNSDLFPEDGPQWCVTCPDRDGWPCPTLRALASVYGDHPDCDPVWASGDTPCPPARLPARFGTSRKRRRHDRACWMPWPAGLVRAQRRPRPPGSSSGMCRR